MMKFLLFMIFLIPLVNNYMLFSFFFLFLIFLFVFCTIFSYFSFFSYGYGVDLISYWLIILSFFIVFLMIISSINYNFVSFYVSEFLFLVLVMVIFLFMAFSSTNFLLFYFYFEASMIPVLFLIFGWGYQPERLVSGYYFLFYTLFGSLPMLLGIFYLYSCGSLYFFLINIDLNIYLYYSLVFAFLVKMPMFFFHFWLPSAHVEAPVSGSMILAGVMLKLGGYGLYRVFLFSYFYSISINYVFVCISMFGSLIISVMCLFQVDIKSLIAYSSVSHMSLVISGLMVFNIYGLVGSLVLMLGHGLCSSGLFFLSNSVYERSHSRSLLINRGFLSFMPIISMFWFLFSINNMASPPSLNLFGEVLLFNSLISWLWLMFLFIGLSSFFSCCYSIYLFSCTQHGSLSLYAYLGNGGCLREYYILFVHWFPLNLLFLFSDLMLLNFI